MIYFLFDIFSSVPGYPTQAIVAESEEAAKAIAISSAGGEENLRGFRECSLEEYESARCPW